MKLTIQRMARIAILSALAVGLRSAFIGLPNIQPITAMFFCGCSLFGFGRWSIDYGFNHGHLRIHLWFWSLGL